MDFFCHFLHMKTNIFSWQNPCDTSDLVCKYQRWREGFWTNVKLLWNLPFSYEKVVSFLPFLALYSGALLGQFFRVYVFYLVIDNDFQQTARLLRLEEWREAGAASPISASVALCLRIASAGPDSTFMQQETKRLGHNFINARSWIIHYKKLHVTCLGIAPICQNFLRI